MVEPQAFNAYVSELRVASSSSQYVFSLTGDILGGTAKLV
jgi:hypothetical protein